MIKHGCQKYSVWVPRDPFYTYEGCKCPQGFWNILYYFDFEYFVFQIFAESFSHSSSHQILAQTFSPFDCLRFPLCNFSCKFSIIGLNSGLKFSCKVISLYLRQEIFIFSCKVLFLEIGWFNFQENIVVLVRRLKFFSAGCCIFQPVTCGGEVIFHILRWKSNFVYMRKK